MNENPKMDFQQNESSNEIAFAFMHRLKLMVLAMLAAFRALLEAQVLHKHVVVRNLQKQKHRDISGCSKLGGLISVFVYY